MGETKTNIQIAHKRKKNDKKKNYIPTIDAAFGPCHKFKLLLNDQNALCIVLIIHSSYSIQASSPSPSTLTVSSILYKYMICMRESVYRVHEKERNKMTNELNIECAITSGERTTNANIKLKITDDSSSAHQL